ncbi:MAG: hypothetical protein J7639_09515 [Paenibacillaceae bacterium]|nr:hypothetical protein [Paenibacillaceae bacterium]
MNGDDYVLLWSLANVRVLDIRHATLANGDTLQAYRIPASGFLFASRGGARVRLDGAEHAAERFHVLHAGKGTCLDIELTDALFEYSLIFYKATIPLPASRPIVQLLERTGPFHVQYGMAPHNPLLLLQLVQGIERQWRQSQTLDKLHAKAAQYQFVHELLRQQDANVICDRSFFQLVPEHRSRFHEKQLELIADLLVNKGKK